MLPDYCVIGKRIKELRLKFNMTQEELADKINVSVVFLSRVERGNTQINLKRLTQIAEIFYVSPGYLLTGSSMASKEYLRKDFSELLEKCTSGQQRLIYKIGELIVSNKLEL